jgi:uncharacterized SAM-binding protein YcdF (DUF218 family)
MEVLLGKIMETVILPPGLIIVLILFGLLLRRRFHRTGQSFVIAGFTLLILLSMPLVSGNLMHLLQTYPALSDEQISNLDAKAIIVLGGGRYADAPEYGKDTISRSTLERCRYGAYLQRKSKLPILVTGGSVYSQREPEGELMKEVLENNFLTLVHWVEGKSRTTYQNAIYSYEVLEKENIKDVVIVTHAFHMPRSVEAFEQAGFNVTPAPMGFNTKSTQPFYFQVLPSLIALQKARTVLHEWVGRLWYNLRYY